MNKFDDFDWSTLCHYCDSEADYESMLQEIMVCENCVKEYVKQEVLKKIWR